MTHNALHISLLCLRQAFRESSFVWVTGLQGNH